MIISLIAFALIALIAYWWANEGAFSALLHMVCVIMAGAIAFALWEPVVFDLLQPDGKMAGLVPGVILLSIFIVVLLLLRKGADLAAPEGAFLPEVPNLIVGGVFGLVSGTLTVGILLIGIGFIHQPLELMGYKGWHRVPGGPEAQGTVAAPESGLILPINRITAKFFEQLSKTTLKPDIPGSTPLAWANPDLDRLSSLVRDTVHDDQGKLGSTFMPPSAIKSVDAQMADAPPREGGKLLVVTVTIDSKGFDFRGGLLLPSSQVRVIGTIPARTVVYHPAGWAQEAPKKKPQGAGAVPGNQGGDDEPEAPKGTIFRMFSGDEMYATSPTARDDATLKFAFAVPSDFTPRYVQIRGTRRELRAKTVELAGLLRSMGAGEKIDRGIIFGSDITTLVQSGPTAARFGRGFKASTQDIKQAGGELNEERRVITVNGTFQPRSGAQTASGSLKPKGYHAEEGAALVRVQVLGGKPEENSDLADIFLAAREFRLPADARIQLLNDRNEHWYPIGFELITETGRATVVYRDEEIRTINDLRARPRAGSTDRFFLLFEVPEGTVLTELRLDEEVIGTISSKVAERYVR